MSVYRRDVVIDADWLTTTAMAILAVLSFAFAFAEFRRIGYVNFTERVSGDTLILAAVGFILSFSLSERLLRLGFFLLGLDAGLRACVYYLHAPERVQLGIAVSARFFDVAAWIAIFASVILWFRSVAHLEDE